MLSHRPFWGEAPSSVFYLDDVECYKVPSPDLWQQKPNQKIEIHLPTNDPISKQKSQPCTQ